MTRFLMILAAKLAMAGVAHAANEDIYESCRYRDRLPIAVCSMKTMPDDEAMAEAALVIRGCDNAMSMKRTSDPVLFEQYLADCAVTRNYIQRRFK